MAENKPSGLIIDKVKIRHIQRTIIFSLAVNEHFADPDEMDPERGVDRHQVEVLRAERAIVPAVLGYYTPVDVREWVRRMQRREGGLPRIAHELMDTSRDMPAVPATYQPRSNKHNKPRAEVYEGNLLRALQRSAEARRPGRKQEHPTGIRETDYLKRIALYEMRNKDVVLGVWGTWAFSETEEYKRIGTDRQEPDQLRVGKRVIAHGGAAFVAEIENLLPFGLVLKLVHGLDVQVMPHGRQD